MTPTHVRGGVQKKKVSPSSSHPTPSHAHPLSPARAHTREPCAVHATPRRLRAGARGDSSPRPALPPVHGHVAHEPIPGGKPRGANGAGEGALPPVDVAHVLVPVATGRGGARCKDRERKKGTGSALRPVHASVAYVRDGQHGPRVAASQRRTQRGERGSGRALDAGRQRTGCQFHQSTGHTAGTGTGAPRHVRSARAFWRGSSGSKEGQNPRGDQGESKQTKDSGSSSGGAHLSSLGLLLC